MPERITRAVTATERYLILPVKNGAPKIIVAVDAEGKRAREFDIELATDAADWWAFLDLDAFKGKELILSAEGIPTGALDLISQSAVIPGQDTLYKEVLRPQFHFTSRRGWNNDPNGLVYFEGEYHLYYQHNPYGWGWGNMHWGHAVSPDMIHWRELPIAIYPREYNDWVFSGSAVVDKDNTSGFATGANGVLIAAYTSTGRGECIVYSNDKGRTWTEYEGNPVVKHTGRDPRLLWHSSTKQWVMAVYNEPGDNKQCIVFYTSPDLKTWTFQSRIDGYYECPDIFELPAPDGGAAKWILTAANSEYAIGSFNGHTFTPETPKLPGHRGNAFYAAQTWSDMPAGDDRVVQIGWSTIETKGMPFNQMMSIPNELTLVSTPDGLRMAWNPIRELASIVKEERGHAEQSLPEGMTVLEEASNGLMDIQAEIAADTAKEVTLIVRGVPVIWDIAKKELRCADKTAPIECIGGKLQIRVLSDRTSLEIYAEDGVVYMPMGAVGPVDAGGVSIEVKGGAAKLLSAKARELKSIWE